MTRARLLLVTAAMLVVLPSGARAQLVGGVRVAVHDMQDLTVPGADVAIKAESSGWTQSAVTNTDGLATFPAVPLGQYVVTVTLDGFSPSQQRISVVSNVTTPVSVRLAVAGVSATVQVSAVEQTVNPESTRTETTVRRDDIIHDPGADRSGSLAMITNNAPGAYMLHDHLHSRGGHGVSWEIDGVPVPSSAMAAVGSQFDPKDVDSLEINRGGLSTTVGDRPYGVFNVVPRSGFEGSRFGDVTASYGSYQTGNVHLALGDHTTSQKLAYYASGSVNRTDRGLERVDIPVIHDEAHGVSGFASMLYNPAPHEQFRLVAASRHDRYQVPNIAAQAALGIDDSEIGNDTFTNLTWLHTSDAGHVLTVSPYYHVNNQQYLGGVHDPLITSDDRTSHYVGGYASYGLPAGRHTLRLGTDSFAEHDRSLFGLTETTGALRAASQEQALWASVIAVFAEDSYRTTSWLTINGGVRFERFAGTVTEHAGSPRAGAAISIPHVGVARLSYSQYYEHPPTSTIAGPILDFALTEGFGFLPVFGERDHVVEAGLGVPIHGWTLDLDAYRNTVDNLLDHDVLGHSNLLLPLSIAQGRVRAFESTLRSPLVRHRLQVHYAFAYQVAEGRGAVTGGMIDFRPPVNNGWFYLDHDQRVTFNTGATLTLPAGFWVSGTVLVGSGFLLGNGPGHLPAHTTGDLALGKSITDRVQIRVSGTNLTNEQYLTGFENAFAGTHYAAPREVAVQLQYKFHY